MILASCGSQVVTEDTFAPRDDVERAAQARIQHWVAVAETWIANSSAVPDEHRDEVVRAIGEVRSALARYHELRQRGSMRAAVIAPVEVSATAILADDATGFGLGNDVLLVPLALAAAATYLITDAVASERELSQAWNQVLIDSGELASAVQSALLAAGIQTRQDCIDQYVACQLYARRSFPRSRCQVCMHRCIVSDFIWPDEKGCQYR